MTLLDSRKYFTDPATAAFIDQVQRGDLASVTAALRSGQDPNVKGLHGIRPIHFVFAASSAEVAQALLAAGADPNAKAPNGNTPLHYAVQQRTAEFTEVLLRFKADPNILGENDKPALYSALSSPAGVAILPMLAKAGVDVNKTWGGFPPVQSAMVRQKWQFAALLLELGADPLQKNKQGQSAGALLCEMLAGMAPVEPGKRWVAVVGDRLGAKEGTLPCAELLKAFR